MAEEKYLVADPPLNVAVRGLLKLAHDAVLKGWGLNALEWTLAKFGRSASSDPSARIFVNDDPAEIAAATDVLKKRMPQRCNARHMEFGRPAHLPGLIREVFLRGIPLSLLRQRARRWHPDTEKALMACISTLGPISNLQGMMCKLFVEAMSFNDPGHLPVAHPAVVELSTAVLQPTKGDYILCPHPVCRRHRYDPIPMGLHGWGVHFIWHYNRSGGFSDFATCWAVYWLSEVAGNEHTICSGDLTRFRPFRAATRKELESLFTALCTGDGMEEYGPNLHPWYHEDELTRPVINGGHNALVEACRQVHCLWLRLQ